MNARPRAVLAIASVLAAFAVACGRTDSLDPAASPAAVHNSSTTTYGPSPTPTATPASAAGPIVTRAIIGLVTHGHPRAPDRRVAVPPVPPSPFLPWNGRDVVLYDRATMTELNLGSGVNASFSPDGRRLAWMTSAPSSGNVPEIWVHDTETNRREFIASGVLDGWVNASTVALRGSTAVGARTLYLDVVTGAVSDMGVQSPRWPVVGGRWQYQSLGGQWVLADVTGAVVPLAVSGPDSPMSQDGTALFTTFAGSVFEVDPETANARFLVTIGPKLNFVHVSEFGVVWGEDWCNPDRSRAKTLVYGRETGSLIEIAGAMETRVGPDRTLIRNVVVQALLDLDSLRYTMVLPTISGVVAWAPALDRAALSGAPSGRDGPCM